MKYARHIPVLAFAEAEWEQHEARGSEVWDPFFEDSNPFLDRLFPAQPFASECLTPIYHARPLAPIKPNKTFRQVLRREIVRSTGV